MSTKNPNIFVLVDGSSYLYRAFHALPPLMNSKGEPTGAVYGVINMLRKLIREQKPTYIAVVFDAKGKTFRDDLYEKYKANRSAMPDDLQVQIEPLYDIIKAMGLPILAVEGVEADDIIGTLAVKAKQMGMTTIISTGDKDLAQLVTDGITLVNTMTDTIYDRTKVLEKFGVGPEGIVDYLTLVGDSVDNIPGVPGVGPKTAAKWLNEYGSLDQIIEKAQEIKGKVGDNLREFLPQIPLTRELVTIKQDLDLVINLEQLKPAPADNETLRKLFTWLEFKTWLAELLSAPSLHDEHKETKKNYQTIFTEQEFKTWLQQLNQTKFFAFDIETNSLDYMTAEIVGLAFSLEAKKAVYIPFAHDYTGAPEQLNREWVLQQLKPILEDPNYKKVGHNLKFDKSVLLNYGIHLHGIEFDTMLESYVLDSTGTRHNMDSLALKYLGYRTIHFEDIAGKGVKQLTFNQIPMDLAAAYAAEDADITLQLHQALWPRITENKGLEKTLQEIEIPLLSVLAHMERRGVLVDAKLLARQSHDITERLVVLEEQVCREAGHFFNLSSPKQLQEILFQKLNLPVLEKTPTGQPSTAESVLQELALQYNLPKLILEHRSLSKLKSTYTDRLPEQINSKTGRVHTCYQQAVAATGRLSSTDPNLQNIPIRNEEGRKIRQAFIAAPGCKIVAADYSQIELRIMAHIAQDENLLNAFAKGLDIHAATAAEVLGVSLDQISAEQRRSAKAINFGLIYGMSVFGLAKQLGVEREAAQAYMDLYFARYPKVKKYMEQTRQQAHKKGYVETISGRRLNLPEINSRNLQRQRAAERAAINAPLQGTAADIIKTAMITLDQALQKSNLNAHMILQVHDELVFEIAEKDIPAAVELIRTHMVQAGNLCIPLVVDIGIGQNWDEAH